MASKSQSAAVSSHTALSITNAKKMISRVLSAALNSEKTAALEGWPTDGHPPVPMLYGPAGIGKTSLVYQAAKENDVEQIVMIRAAELRPEDVTGPPFPHLDEPPAGVKIDAYGPKDLGYSKFHPPFALLQLTKEYRDREKAKHDALVAAGQIDPSKDAWKEPGPAIIFFDELPNAQPEMQAPLHSLILDRTFGVEGYHLRDNVIMIAAGNRVEDGAYVHELSAPMKTRLFPHILVSPTIEEWVAWGRRNNIHPAILAFLPQNEALFQTYDSKSKAFTYANYRTWAAASGILALFENDEDLLLQALEGTVGPGAATPFYGFLKTARKAPTARQIAEGPESVSIHEKDPDIAYVACENMLANARRIPGWVKEVYPNAKSDSEAFANMIDSFILYGSRMHDQMQEVFFPALMNLDGNMPPETVQAVFKSKNFSKVRTTAAQITRVVTEGRAAEATAKKKRG